MSSLLSELDNAGALNVSNISAQKKELQLLCEANESLFTKVCERKPETSPLQHALGVLTKAQIEAISRLQTQSSASSAMLEAISSTVGSEHLQKFSSKEGQELLLITHLWIYLLGRLNMDFSYANDHALQTSNLLSPLVYKPIEGLRCQFMETFYQGLQQHKHYNPNRSVFHSIKSFVSRIYNGNRSD